MEKPKRVLRSIQAGFLSFPGRVGFHGILGGLVAPENILHPDLLSHLQRETQSRSREGCRICRQAGSFLVGLGKLNLACWAWQTRDWGETQSQHCGWGAGSSYKLTRNKFRLEIQEVCHVTRSSSFLGLWPLSFLWAKLSLIGLGGLLVPGGWACSCWFSCLPAVQQEDMFPKTGALSEAGWSFKYFPLWGFAILFLWKPTKVVGNNFPPIFGYSQCINSGWKVVCS